MSLSYIEIMWAAEDLHVMTHRENTPTLSYSTEM